ncbi:MAG: hypothetical protein HOP16_16165, partial [Acidobacteria bacterium]|nr:hypothetical protein [Acidobacteriota bacterium]
RSPLETVFRLAAPRGDAAAERLAHVLGRTVLPAPGELPSAAEAAIVPQGEPLAEALRAPEPTRLISDLIDGRVDELRPRSELADVVDDVDARLKVMNTTIAELNRQIKKRPTAADIVAAPPVKKLVTAAGETSKRLDTINAELLAQVDALKKRIEHLEGK